MAPHLGIEYRQWKFSKHLYDIFCGMLKLGERALNPFITNEVKSILEHWILSLQQNRDRTKFDQQLPIFPIVEENDSVNIKLANLIIEKRFLTDYYLSLQVVKTFLSVIDEFRTTCEREGNPSTPSCNTSKNSNGEIMIEIGKFQSKYNHRFAFLIENYGLIPTACMVLRYESLGSGSYQWGDPKCAYRSYYIEFGVRYEGFASPLNSRLLGQECAKFCSVFPDTDASFGSLGDFFTLDHMKYQGGWTVNPPFIETILKEASLKVVSTLDEGASSYYFMNYPCWTDCEGWIILNTSKYKVARFDLKSGEFLIQDAYCNTLKPNMRLSFFIIGHLPKSVPNPERVREVIYKGKNQISHHF